MSGQQQGKTPFERETEGAPKGKEIDLQEVARSVNSGRVEAEEQSVPEDLLRPGNAEATGREPGKQPS
ncbi:MAG TPA: hypothetical protein VIL85_21855 [Thermomicrobiales bacterium]|jgi:hypothetical protein